VRGGSSNPQLKARHSPSSGPVPSTGLESRAPAPRQMEPVLSTKLSYYRSPLFEDLLAGGSQVVGRINTAVVCRPLRVFGHRGIAETESVEKDSHILKGLCGI